jgi:hypothetical protein
MGVLVGCDVVLPASLGVLFGDPAVAGVRFAVGESSAKLPLLSVLFKRFATCSVQFLLCCIDLLPTLMTEMCI